jgi:acyl-coenzyme A thioesterase PaaI-like protein
MSVHHLRATQAWLRATPEDPVEAGFDELAGALCALQDATARSRPDAATAARLSATLREAAAALDALAVPDAEQPFGRLTTPGRGQTLVPPYAVERVDDEAVTGTVTFGDFHRGENGAAHGGAVSTFFDEVCGTLANAVAGRPARTAYLRVDYRSVTLVGVEHVFAARVERVEGRKHTVTGTLHAGDRLVAEAQSLFVTLRPGQQ